MLWIDLKYTKFLNGRLRNFKQKSDYLFNASCPVCGDSKTNKKKARLYIYRQKIGMFVKCHKCGYSTNLGNLIKYIDQTLYSEYVMERFTNDSKPHNDHNKLEEAFPQLSPVKLDLLEDDVLSSLKRADTLPDTHYVAKYLIKRKIPKEQWHLLYYTPKFFKFVNQKIVQKFTNLEEDHPRLIIPFFKPSGKCFALQGRAFGKELPKYFTIKIDETEEKIFGLERIDYSKTIYITEGPIDSLFLPNGLAVSGSHLDTPTIRQILTNAVIISDNEPRHKDIVRIIKKNIQNGYKVCLFPDNFPYKDINEAIMGGMSQEEILNIINQNTFQGLEAELRFTSWKRTN